MGLLLFILKEWSNYYSSENPNAQKIVNKRYTNCTGELYILNSYFGNLQAYQGGAMCIKDCNCKMLIESAAFNKCTTSGGFGGAIYFQATGESVLSKICGWKCRTTESDNQFYYIYINGGTIDNKNSVLLTTVALCDSGEWGQYATNNQYGLPLLKELNHSFNRCYTKSVNVVGVFTGYHKDIQSLIEYSTISNSTKISDVLMYFDNAQFSGVNYKLLKTNIIFNKQLKSPYGNSPFIQADLSNIYFDSCCMLENQYSTSPIIKSAEGEIIITNCYFEFGKEKIKGNNVKIKGSQKAFINGISFLASADCSASYEKVGTLVPEIPGNAPTNKNGIFADIRSFISVYVVLSSVD